MLAKLFTLTTALSLMHSVAALDNWFQCNFGGAQLSNNQNAPAFASARNIGTLAKYAGGILDFSVGMANTVSSTGTGGKPSLSDFTLDRRTDASTPIILNKLASGVALDNCVVVTTNPATGSSSLQTVSWYLFKSVVFTALELHSNYGDTPTETVSFSYSSVEFDFQPYNAAGNAASTGPVIGGFDKTSGKVITS